MRKRSDVTTSYGQAPVIDPSNTDVWKHGPHVGLPIERTPEGTINNCNLQYGDVKNCQMCDGVSCPDKTSPKPAPARRTVDMFSAPLPVVAPPRTVTQDDSVGPNVFSTQDVGEEIELTWGAETIRMAEYVSNVIGPFTEKTKVRAGETRMDARRRLYCDMVQFAESARREKIASMAKAGGYGRAT